MEDRVALKITCFLTIILLHSLLAVLTNLPNLMCSNIFVRRLFILYLDRSSNMVRNVSDVCSARNGAHRKLPEISPTYSGTICVQFDPCFQVITIFEYSATEDHLCILVELRGSEGFEKTSTNRCSFI